VAAGLGACFLGGGAFRFCCGLAMLDMLYFTKSTQKNNNLRKKPIFTHFFRNQKRQQRPQLN
jgi:hypothetical protein